MRLPPTLAKRMVFGKATAFRWTYALSEVSPGPAEGPATYAYCVKA